jgi:tRNA threonylcarbamoyladenosine modification (KEOPS) complex  Pcc1 subunit
MKYTNNATISIKKRFSIDYKKIINQMRYVRSSIIIKEDKKYIKLNIKATDITAMRASINSIIRDIKIADDVMSVKFRKRSKK